MSIVFIVALLPSLPLFSLLLYSGSIEVGGLEWYCLQGGVCMVILIPFDKYVPSCVFVGTQMTHSLKPWTDSLFASTLRIEFTVYKTRGRTLTDIG